MDGPRHISCMNCHLALSDPVPDMNDTEHLWRFLRHDMDIHSKGGRVMDSLSR
jgi:hypothetical protein